MVLPFGRNDAKQTSHAELLNPTAPTNEYPSTSGTSMEKLSPLFESTVIDFESVETLTKGDIECLHLSDLDSYRYRCIATCSVVTDNNRGFIAAKSNAVNTKHRDLTSAPLFYAFDCTTVWHVKIDLKLSRCVFGDACRIT